MHSGDQVGCTQKNVFFYVCQSNFDLSATQTTPILYQSIAQMAIFNKITYITFL